MSVIPFVTVDRDGKYVLNEEAAQWFATSEHTSDFAVMMAAGKFRTGKSYICNQLNAFPPGKGFGVGDTVQACTRGIWMSCTPLPKQNASDRTVILMDTEGIDALDVENAEHDVCIVALAVMLSSVFLFNSMSHLDEAAVQTLNLMTRVVESLGSDSSHHPTLYWVLRDFALQLVDAKGNALSHAEYLEQALHTTPTTSGSKCATREAIKALFPDRHLVTLPRPQKGESAQKLHFKSASARNAKFDQYVIKFREHICKHARPVSASGVAFTGTLYVEYVRSILHKLNECGSIPKMQDSWTLLANAQHAELETAARTRLLESAEADCPTEAEAQVKAWVTKRCRETCASLQFMPPKPDVDALAQRLEAELFRHCKALGRIQDVQALAANAAKERVAAFCGDDDDDQTIRKVFHQDPGRLLEAPSASYATLFKAKVLEELVSRWELIKRGLAAEGEARSIQTSDLALQETKLRLEYVEQELQASKLREEQQRTALVLITEDVSTMTDEDVVGPTKPQPPAEEDEHEDEEKHDDEEVNRQRWLVELESSLSSADERARRAEEALAQAEAREEQMHRTFAASMDELREESLQKIQQYRDERDAARADALARQHQKDTLEAECDKLRGLAREAQQHTIDMHRSTLEELRRRDVETRELTDAHRREWSDATIRAEQANHEVRGLKRQLVTLTECEGEAKKLRQSLQQAQVDRARDEAAREQLKVQIKTERAEAEALRRTRYDLERKVALLEASTKLETCKRALI